MSFILSVDENKRTIRAASVLSRTFSRALCKAVGRFVELQECPPLFLVKRVLQ